MLLSKIGNTFQKLGKVRSNWHERENHDGSIMDVGIHYLFNWRREDFFSFLFMWSQHDQLELFREQSPLTLKLAWLQVCIRRNIMEIFQSSLSWKQIKIKRGSYDLHKSTIASHLACIYDSYQNPFFFFNYIYIEVKYTRNLISCKMIM